MSDRLTVGQDLAKRLNRSKRFGVYPHAEWRPGTGPNADVLTVTLWSASAYDFGRQLATARIGGVDNLGQWLGDPYATSLVQGPSGLPTKLQITWMDRRLRRPVARPSEAERVRQYRDSKRGRPARPYNRKEMADG